MLKQLLKQKWYILIIFILIIAEPSINSVLNFWLQRLFNAAAPGVEKAFLLRMLTAGFLLWILKRVVNFTSSLLKTRFICNAKQEVKHKLFVNLLGLDTSNISRIAASGEYISLFTNDITILETRFFNQIVALISNIFSIAILGTSFLALNKKLAISILVFGTITMFVPVAFSKNLNAKNLLYSECISKFTQRMKEYIVAYPTIKNYAIEKIVAKKFDELNIGTEEAKFEADYALTLANNIGSLLSWFMQFIGVGFGLMLVVNGEIMIGTVVAAQSFASDLANPLQNIICNINSIRSVKEIVKKIERLSSGTLSSGNILNKRCCNNADEQNSGFEISFDKFSLAIGNKTIIDTFSFTFEEGKKYLIVGLNGSGKSTLFKALKKWYRATGGRILFAGKDITELKSSDLSKVISYLNEDVSLFSGTVRDNISLYRQYNEEVFQQAISEAQIKLNLEREIGDEGNNISSGEQRRIEIARSLLESAKVLIFDEVVSTLDIESAYEIERMALNFKDQTVIFISHNFSGKLIKEYDEILVMEAGRLLAHGTYEELLSSCEYFKRICEIKFG